MSEHRHATKERHYFSKAAAILLLGAGALSACSSVVEGIPVTTVEKAAVSSPEAKLPALDDIIQPTETAPRSPRNDTSRCVFTAAQLSLNKFMTDPHARKESRGTTVDVYRNPPESTEQTYSVLVDTSDTGSATIAFDTTLTGKFSLRGELTIPVNGSVESSIAAINPVNLNDDYHIAPRSGIFNLQTGRGEVISKSYTDDIAAVNCQTAIEYIQAVS